MIKLISIIICALILAMILKSFKSSIHIFPGLIASVIILVYVATKLSGVLEFIREISARADVDSTYLNIILKSIGICFLGEFATSLCKDSGENTLASNAEVLCKCSIVVAALPVYSDILNMIIKLWESI